MWGCLPHHGTTVRHSGISEVLGFYLRMIDHFHMGAIGSLLGLKGFGNMWLPHHMAPLRHAPEATWPAMSRLPPAAPRHMLLIGVKCSGCVVNGVEGCLGCRSLRFGV